MRAVFLTPLSLTSSVAALALVLAGCGSKTQLRTPPPPPTLPDGGRIPDSGPPDSGPPDAVIVDCGRAEQFTSPRQPITLEAEATSPAGIERTGWTLVDAPFGSTAENAPLEGTTTTLTPDLEGAFLLQFVAIDREGREARCEVLVHSVVGPPIAICPEEPLVRTPVGVPVTIFGDAHDDTGIASIVWRQVSGPGMAELRVVGGMGAIVELTSSVAGRYVLLLEVIDEDGARDECRIEVQVTAPPIAECPSEPIMAPTRRPVTVSASATDDGRIVRTEWELISRPADSAAEIAPRDAIATTLTPDRRGEYLLVFTATDDDGLTASCEVLVIGTPTPPDVMCPAVVETAPLSEVEIAASAIDDGTIVSWSWRVGMVPPGSRPDAPSPDDAPITRFTPDLAGEYVLQLTVTDDDGSTAACETVVRAISNDGLRIEVFWDTDGTDMDTHLLRPGARAWFDSEDDCYYANCQGTGIPWGGGGTEDDPSLDIDDVDGFGPENINIARPAPGTYRVGVHAFRGFGRVTVRIYCGGSTTEPRQTFGPVAIDGDRVWRVADVDVRGSRCTITDLATAAGPNIISEIASMGGP
jgi:hypothetical protein